MRKTQKNIVGLCGLGVVAIMTIFAATLPGPGASAATPYSFSDELTVVVTNAVPSVTITSPKSGQEVTSLETPIGISYSNAESYVITITYTDEKGEEHTKVIASASTPEGSGSATYNFKEAGEEFGYGDYTVTVTVTGTDGSTVEDSIEFKYVALDADITSTGDSGEVVVILDYDVDEDVPEDDRVSKIIIEILDENGKPIPGVDPIEVDPPLDHVTLDLNDYNLPEGDYIIAVTPYNSKGKELPTRREFRVHFDGSIVVPATADTGGLFKGLNISSKDYLITGLGVFLVVGIGGIILIGKKSKR